MLRLLSHSTSYFSANYVNYVARSMSLYIIAVASVVNNLKIYNIAMLLLAAIYFDAIKEYCFNDVGCKNISLLRALNKWKLNIRKSRLLLYLSLFFAKNHIIKDILYMFLLKTKPC